MKLLSVLVLIPLILIGAGSSFAADLTGTWQSVEYYRNGKILPEMVGKARYEFLDDGTYTHKMGPWLTAKGTYEVRDDRVELTSDIGARIDLRREEDALVVENPTTGLKIIYSKTE
ncbi:MAG: hypothetical protein GF409_03445 [Candidatus Omnitrophica bacterium]|nr:hypothetical protein [Candidatus Omnitrophota bacterium]